MIPHFEAVFDGTHGFEVQLGGVLCPKCTPVGGSVLALAPETLVFLENWRGGGHATIRPTRRILQELENAVTAHLTHHLKRRPRSLALLPALEELEESPTP